MVSIGFYHLIDHKENKFVFSVGGECSTNDDYISMLQENEITTIVDTNAVRGLSRNSKLMTAGIEEVRLPFMEECYTPLPSQLKTWLSILRANCRGGKVRVGVSGITNGPFLIAIALMELGLTFVEAQAKVSRAGGHLYFDQECYLQSYAKKGIGRRRQGIITVLSYTGYKSCAIL